MVNLSSSAFASTFSAIMRKRVFTLVFERSSELGWDTVEKLISARRNRGVVLCTASTIKSLQLKLLEKMDVLRDTLEKHGVHLDTKENKWQAADGRSGSIPPVNLSAAHAREPYRGTVAGA